jgi:hypothetical protein
LHVRIPRDRHARHRARLRPGGGRLVHLLRVRDAGAGPAAHRWRHRRVTIAAHVPRNDALEALDPHGGAATDGWAGYVREWTAWNHVRLVTSLAAAALLTIALIAG